MNASPTARSAVRKAAARHLLAAAVASVLAVPAMPSAFAQSEGPIRLVPVDPARPEATEGFTPRSGTAPSREGRPAPMPREIGNGILAVDDLGAVSPDAAGVIDAGMGGLPVDMWADSRRAVVAEALNALPVAAPSPARQGLARRLLLTVAAPPSGPGPALIDLRVDRLVALGATEDALRLIAAVPADAHGEAVAKAQVEALLVENRLDDACSAAEQGLTRWDAPFWQKAQVFCALRAERREQANLNLTMLREQGVDDPAFVWAAETLSGLRAPTPGDIGRPTPLTLAMMIATGRSLPGSLLDSPEPWVLRALALAPDDAASVPADVRLPAAERAVGMGALNGRALADLYRAQTFAEDAFAQPLADIVDAPEPQTGALLFQLAERQSVPAALAEVVVRAMDLARRTGTEAAAAAVYAPLIERLEPTADILWFAETAGRALYRAGRFDSAAEWYQAAATAAPANADARQAADALWPLYRLAVEAVSDRWPEARMTAWRTLTASRSESAPGNEPPQRRAARLRGRLLSLLQATGDRVEVEDWAALWAALPPGDGFVPSASVWHAVGRASDQLRVGETVVLGLMAQGDAAPADLSDAALYRAVESLRLVGLEEPARRIAVEAAIASGL